MSNSHVGDTPEPEAKGPPAAAAPAGELVAYDQYIDTQLHTARRQVRRGRYRDRPDDAGGRLARLFLARRADSIIGCCRAAWGNQAGGWRLWFIWPARCFICGATLLPLFIHRINPVYAARAIERSKPSLKNSLINFLLLRRRPDGAVAERFSGHRRACRHATGRGADRGLDRPLATDQDRLRFFGPAVGGGDLQSRLAERSRPNGRPDHGPVGRHRCCRLAFRSWRSIPATAR